jgi:hypothetical protein
MPVVPPGRVAGLVMPMTLTVYAFEPEFGVGVAESVAMIENG